LLFNLKSSTFGGGSHHAKPLECADFRLRRQQSLTSKGQAFNWSACHSEFLGGLIYFGLLLVARATRLQVNSTSTLSAHVSLSRLRRNRNQPKTAAGLTKNGGSKQPLIKPDLFFNSHRTIPPSVRRLNRLR